MPLDLVLDVGHLECSIGEHRLYCTSRLLVLGPLRVTFDQILDLRVSERLFFVELALCDGTHRFYASPRPWEDGDWRRLASHLLRWHDRARQLGDRDDVPLELLHLRRSAPG